MKKVVKKAQLGAIIKGIKGAMKGGKAAYVEAKAAKAAKKAANAERYGDSGGYARLEDMKRSEFYRKRDGTRSNAVIPVGVAGAMATSKDNKSKVETNKTKVQANKKKVAANAAKYKKAGGSVKSKLVKAQTGRSIKEKNLEKPVKETGKDASVGSAAYRALFNSKQAMDSANYYRNTAKNLILSKSKDRDAITKNIDNLQRQYNKGKAGYDAMGNKKPVVKKKTTAKSKKK